MHQTKELWFFQVLTEVRRAMELLEAGYIGKASRLLGRISLIFDVMTSSWDVLATLSKAEFLRFRGPFMESGASGVQSLQFRQLEFLLGIKDRSEDGLGRQTDPELRAKLSVDLESRSLWDATNEALSDAGYRIADGMLNRTWSEPYKPDKSVELAWRLIAADPVGQQPFYGLGQQLLKVARALATWRAKHIRTVRVFIGDGPGSGGTDGVPYLKGTLELHAFPELWAVRNKFKSGRELKGSV